MTLIQILSNSFKKKLQILSFVKISNYRILNINPIIFFSFIIFFSILFFSISNLINEKNKKYKDNLKLISKSNEFSNLTNFFISKINSPYEEVGYLIKNNDTVEKILKKFEIKNQDIKNISKKLKEKKLSNIYSGRKLSLIFKKQEDNSNTVISLVFPINNTSSVEIKKSKDSFVVKEHIRRLYKREVVARNLIRNNLYSAAIDAEVEPNIIIEFARIFGFEVDFQRDIRKGDWFEILYE